MRITKCLRGSINLDKQYVEMIGKFSVDPDFSPVFDLLMGIHPETLSQLSEVEERVLHFLKYLDANELFRRKPECGQEHIAYLWFKYFPSVKDVILSNKYQTIYESLWDYAYQHFDVLGLGYAFYPPHTRVDYYDKYRQVSEQSRIVQDELGRRSADSFGPKGQITWSFSFSLNSALGKIIEGKNGLAANIRKGLGLLHFPPGLLCNYLSACDLNLLDLDHYQFEDFVAAIFQMEGWEVTQTKKTRDGGKDIIIQKMVDGDPVLAYVQAKRYSTAKIGVSVVKEFAATMIGDQVNKGYIVTSSRFSKPAAVWLNEKVSGIISVELIDKENLTENIKKISQNSSSVYAL